MPGDEEPKQRRHRPVAIPLIIAFVVWLILLLLYAFPELGTKTNLSFELWLNIGNLVLAGMIFWAALSRFTFAPVEEAEEPSARAEGEEAPIEAEVVPEPSGKDGAVADRPKPRAAPSAAAERVKAAAERAKGVTVAPAEGAGAAPAQRPSAGEEGVRVVEWPPKKPGGVYSDTLVQVDYDLVLNMRTELGRVCGNCEGLPECKKRVGGRLPDDVFEWNFECKEGLKRELAKVRRAKQAEAVAKAATPLPEVAQAVEARSVEAVPAAEPKGEPKAEPKAEPGPATKATPEPTATSSVAEAKAESAPQEPTYAAPPAYKTEAAAPPVKGTGEAPATPVPAPGTGPAPAPVPPPAPAVPDAADDELELEPEDAAVETAQPAPAPPKEGGKPKLRKKLLKRKD